MPFDVRTTPDGAVRFRVTARPGASRSRIVGLHGDALKVAVSAPPERGRANEAVEELIACALGVRASDVMVVAGARGRDKEIEVRGVAAAEVRRRLMGEGA